MRLPERAASVILLLTTATLAFGQGVRMPSDEPVEDRDLDQPSRREQWFQRGRIVPGEMAAALLYRAHQHKMLMRAARLAAAPQTGFKDLADYFSSAGWTPRGPAPLASDASGFGQQDYSWVSGRATAVAVDPADPTGNTVYLGGAYGGVWKSSNATNGSFGNASGVVWTPLADNQATLSVGAIAIQPGNINPSNSVVLVGTGETNSSVDSYYGLGILRSTDGGATWTLITQDSTGTRQFAGMGFSKIAFSTAKPSLVVAATAGAAQGDIEGLENPPTVNRGIYFSTDAGASWSYASVKDGGVTVAPGSVTSVVYNETAGKFFAALRYHGIYSSSDGINWTRLITQPGSGLSLAACPTSPSSSACPIYRGEFAVVPGRDELYVWYVDSNSTDQGIFKTTNGGTTWTTLNETGLANCGDSFGCGTSQGVYNLELAAVPSGSATELYAGAVNLFKCTLASGASSCLSGSWLNLTHVYGCPPNFGSIARVHPDQHDVDFMVVNGKAILYFAHDGGIARALDGYTGLNTGACGGANQFDSLSETLGSMTQFVSFSQHPTDLNTILGGTQDNGSPATNQAQGNPSWINVNAGDGGYNEINPDNPTEWFTANIDVSIQRCSVGIACHSQDFPVVIDNTSAGGDGGAFYTPYILDPQATSQIIVGTCRIWRGNSDGSGSGWATGGGFALSPNFEFGGVGGCSGGEVNLVRSLAAGGGKDANNFSKVIYAGTDGFGPLIPTSPVGGHLWVSTDAAGGTGTWADRTGPINPNHFPVSSVAIDTSDIAGLTAYVAIMGFHTSHVWKTTDGGGSWTDFTANLPDAPANALVVDPGPTPSTGAVYVGTDVGVFSSSTGSADWTEVGPANDSGQPGYLPNVAVTALRMFNNGTSKRLRASTYGRGVWEFNLITTPDYLINLSLSTQTVFPPLNTTFNGTLTAFNDYNSPVTLSCTNGGTAPPGTCTPSPNPVTPTPTGAAFILTAGGAIGDYSFNLHGVGSDADATTRDAALTLHVVDFGLTAPVPNNVTVNIPNASQPIAFQATASGSFNGTVTLSCAGLPAGAACSFAPSNVVNPTSGAPVSITLTITTSVGGQAGTFPVVIHASTAGAPADKTQNLTLTVTSAADYTLTVSNPSLSASATTSATFNGTLTAFNGYNNPVNLGCGAGAPPTCTPSPLSVTPTAGGTAFNVTVSSDVVQSYNFNITGTGTDAQAIVHSAPVTFNSTFDFQIVDNSGPQTVTAGGVATYNLDVNPVGSNFPNSATLTCSGLPARSTCGLNPNQLSSGSGDTLVTFTITTTAPIAAAKLDGQSGLPVYALWLSLPALLLIGRFGYRRRKRVMLCLLLLVLLILGLQVACGGGGDGGGGGGGGQPGTPPGTYTNITVTVTSGSLTHTLQVTLTVQ